MRMEKPAFKSRSGMTSILILELINRRKINKTENAARGCDITLLHFANRLMWTAIFSASHETPAALTFYF